MTNIAKILFVCLSAGALLCVPAAAQNQQQSKTPQEQEAELYDYIAKEVERYTRTLDLDPAQEFYADSILTHNLFAMRNELNAKSRAKVSNSDIYVAVQDKWNESTYQAFMKMLSPEQQSKYLKGGATKDKKARDKRSAKRSAKN